MSKKSDFRNFRITKDEGVVYCNLNSNASAHQNEPRKPIQIEGRENSQQRISFSTPSPTSTLVMDTLEPDNSRMQTAFFSEQTGVSKAPPRMCLNEITPTEGMLNSSQWKVNGPASGSIWRDVNSIPRRSGSVPFPNDVGTKYVQPFQIETMDAMNFEAVTSWGTSTSMNGNFNLEPVADPVIHEPEKNYSLNVVIPPSPPQPQEVPFPVGDHKKCQYETWTAGMEQITDQQPAASENDDFSLAHVRMPSHHESTSTPAGDVELTLSPYITREQAQSRLQALGDGAETQREIDAFAAIICMGDIFRSKVNMARLENKAGPRERYQNPEKMLKPNTEVKYYESISDDDEWGPRDAMGKGIATQHWNGMGGSASSGSDNLGKCTSEVEHEMLK